LKVTISNPGGRYDHIFDAFAERRQKTTIPVPARSLAREQRIAGNCTLARSGGILPAEDCCTRKSLLRARGMEPDTPAIHWSQKEVMQ
jgi:hypothetical protein